jgi:hypothetical protein
MIRNGTPTEGTMNSQNGSPRATIIQTAQLIAESNRGRRAQNQLARESSPSLSIE